MIRLNLGAGKKVVPGWLAVGYEDHHDFKADLRDLSIIPDAHADEAMAIHTIEHVNRWEVPAMLLEWKRVLKSGGKLAIECPDLVKCCKNVIAGLPRQEGIQGLFGEWELRDELMMHKHSYAPAEMQQLLEEAGFTQITFVRPHYHGKREHRDLRAECVKP